MSKIDSYISEVKVFNRNRPCMALLEDDDDKNKLW
jgi:hypothetical protein